MIDQADKHHFVQVRNVIDGHFHKLRVGAQTADDRVGKEWRQV